MKRIIGFVLSLIVFLLLSPAFTGIVHAAPPQDFQTTQIIGSGLDGPSGFEFAPDGRIFIIQRTGEVKIYKNGQLLAQNFAVLPSIAEGDRGLIGVTFDPDFTTNKYVYFYYTGLDKLNRVVRLDATTDVGTNSYVVYQTTYPSEQLHVGGSIGFGPDGKLYLAVGDNGYGPNAQDLSNPHGKIHRINKDGSIPVDNPFYGQPGKLPEIWAYGLRNPWRFQFDSATGRLYDGDVGADSWEEINLIEKGKNYGWPNAEGFCTSVCSYTNPIYAYSHQVNGDYASSAITQGPIYHGSMFPQAYEGRLFFGDYAQGFIKSLTLDANGNSTGAQNFDLEAGSVVDLKVALDGSLYYITYYPGALYRVTYNPENHIPVANATSDETKGVSPFTVQFSSVGSYDPDGTPLIYFWNFGDNTTSTNANPSHVYNNNGTYTVQLTVSDSVNSAQARPLVIQVGIPPTVTIGQPKEGDTYKAGDNITYTASAIDGAGFDINDYDIVSEVIFHHETHIHPFLGPLHGRSHTFTTPVTGEASSHTYFEIKVTATDTNGLSTTESVNIYPIKTSFTMQTVPAGLQITLEGIPYTAPHTIEAVINFQFELDTPSQQTLNGKTYVFDHWSDNGSKKHTFNNPATDTLYTAYFVEQISTNKVQNGSFEAGLTPWQLNVQTAATATLSRDIMTGTNGAASAKNDIMKASTTNWHVQMQQQNLALTAGTQYTVSFAAKATSSRTIESVVQKSTSPYTLFVAKPIALTTAWKEFSYTFTPANSESNAFIGFNMAKNTGSVWIDTVSVCEGTCTSIVSPTATPTPSTGSGPTATPTVTPTPVSNQTFTVYDEQLATGWIDWSWDSTLVNSLWNVTAPWAGILLHTDAGFNTAGYTSFTFAVQATKPNQKIGVQLYDSNNASLGNGIDISNYGGDPEVGIYNTYTIPLADLAGSNKIIKDFHIQDISGQATNTIYVDGIGFVGTVNTNPTATPTVLPTTTPTPTPMLQPTATPEVAKKIIVYADELTPGWQNWSWDAVINYAVTNPVYSGLNAVSYVASAAWSGIDFHNPNGVNTSGLTTLHFVVRASQGGQKYGVFIEGANEQPLSPVVPLLSVGGDPVADSWKVYDIPLTSLNAANTMIKGIVIHEISGNAQPAIYIDEIELR